jgi:hypothetical protein
MGIYVHSLTQNTPRLVEVKKSSLKLFKPRLFLPTFVAAYLALGGGSKSLLKVFVSAFFDALRYNQGL